MPTSAPRRLVLAASVTMLIAAGCSGTTESSRPPASVGASPSAQPAAASASVAPSAIPAGSPEPAPSVEPTDPSPEPSTDVEEMTGTAGPGCGTGQKGFFAHRDEVPDVFHFGGATIEFTTAGIGLRNGTYDADDVIPGGIGLSPKELAVRVDPGTHIILRGVGLTITDVSVQTVPWSTVDFSGGLGSSNAERTDLIWRRRADGSISVSAPAKSGDSMVEFDPRWQSACLKGDGVAYGRIVVN
jgi:hypothetical protein